MISEVSALNHLSHPVLHHHRQHRHDDHQGPDIVSHVGNCAKCCNLSTVSSVKYMLHINSDHPYLYDV